MKRYFKNGSILLLFILIVIMNTGLVFADKGGNGKPLDEEELVIAYFGDSISDIQSNSSVELEFSIPYSGEGRWVLYLNDINVREENTEENNPSFTEIVTVESTDVDIRIEFYDISKRRAKLIDSYSATITVIQEPNEPPVIIGDTTVTVNEDKDVFIPITISDTDDVTLSFVGPFNGSLLEAEFGYTYKPNDDFNTTFEDEYFIITADDGINDVSHRVDITVEASQDKPVVENIDNYSITTETGQLGTVTIVATDADREPLEIKENYEYVTTSGLEVTYLSTYVKTEVIDVIVTDGIDEIHVNITVNVIQANRAPTIEGFTSLTVNEDESGTIELVYSDPDSDDIEISLNQPQYGFVSYDGYIFTYTPDDNYNVNIDDDMFEVVISDGLLITSHIVTLNVQPVNDVLITVDDNVTVDLGNEVNVNVLDNDINVDKDELIIKNVTAGRIDGANIIITPVESMSIDYTVDDGDNLYIGTLFITVNEVDGELVYLALGDSIPYGTYYTSAWNYMFGGNDTNSYVEKFASSIQADTFDDRSVSGYNAIDIYNILTGVYDEEYNQTHNLQDVEQLVKDADVITLYVGANDLMDGVARDDRIFSNQGLLKYNLDKEKIDGGLQSFEDNWIEVIDAIETLNDDVTLIVATVYNPYDEDIDPDYYKLMDDYLYSTATDKLGMNHIILNTMTLYNERLLNKFDYRVADVRLAFDDHPKKNDLTGFYNSFCDPHPNQLGQDTIFNVHLATY